MKYLLSILITLAAAAYGISLLLGSGKDHLEKATQIQHQAQKRLEIIREVVNGTTQESASECLTATPETPEIAKTERATTYRISTNDLSSVVLLKLGNPRSRESVGDMEILRYPSCNIVIQSDHVTGWSLR